MDGAVEVEGADEDGVVQGERRVGKRLIRGMGTGVGRIKRGGAHNWLGRRELFRVRGSRTRNPSLDSGNFYCFRVSFFRR